MSLKTTSELLSEGWISFDSNTPNKDQKIKLRSVATGSVRTCFFHSYEPEKRRYVNIKESIFGDIIGLIEDPTPVWRPETL
ncbi:hypothetical protein ACTJIJ_11755 [Niabella sp. 22666]|uniref:hypothetical protein n=1 Tax=Niabella sp. 22666 TaxID=3453954 RepID=UPI003F860F78